MLQQDPLFGHSFLDIYVFAQVILAMALFLLFCLIFGFFVSGR